MEVVLRSPKNSVPHTVDGSEIPNSHRLDVFETFVNHGMNLPYQLHLGCVFNLVNNEMFAISIGDRRISEPSTLSSSNETLPTWNRSNIHY